MSKDPKWKLSKKAKVIPKDQRREFPAEAFEARGAKVRITILLDSDILEYFKERASKQGTPYQTQINAELRAIMDQETSVDDPAAQLRHAKGLIDSALRKIS